MRMLLGLALLVTLTLVMASRRMYVWRRSRLGAALTTGGWVMVALGMALGPVGANLVRPEQLIVVQPLIYFCLGWAGMMVGMQLDRRLPRMLPKPVLRIALTDAVSSAALLTGAAWGVLGLATGRWAASLAAALVLGIGGISWSAEVRSLRRGDPATAQMSGLIRAVSGLGAIVAVVAYGLLIKSMMLGEQGSVVGLTLWEFGLSAGVSLLVGLATGLLGNWLLEAAGRGDGEFLLVVVGLVSLTAGAAAVLGYAPLFVALVTGAALVNGPRSSRAQQRFKRVTIDAEQPVAMGLMLVAGVLADPWIGWRGLGLVAALLAVRWLVKQAGVRRRTQKLLGGRSASPVAQAALMRQSPLAIALGAGYAISPAGRMSDAPLTGGEVLMVLILVGVIAEAWPLLPWRGPTPAASAEPSPGHAPAAGTGTEAGP